MRLPYVGPVKALLLDVDGVLVTPPEMFSAYLARERGLAPGAAAPFFRGPFLDCLVGAADLREALAPFLPEWGYPGDVDDFLAEWFRSEHAPNAALVERVRALRAEGWAVYLATNQERHRVRYLLEEMGLGEIADGELSSATVGARKPDPAYFARVAERLGREPRDLVFWDDAPANVEAARQAGWTAHRYTSVEGFAQVMNELRPSTFALGELG